MFRLISEAATGLTELFFPVLCAGCKSNTPYGRTPFCLLCRENLQWILSEEDVISALRVKEFFPTFIQRAAGLFYFDKACIIQEVIHDIKYNGRPDLARTLGQMLGRAMTDINLTKGHLIPVPIHKERQKKRGYNQAEEIARGICDITDMPLLETLIRRRPGGQSQTTKSRLARRMNLGRSFEPWNAGTADRTEHLIIVDDVITTGSTIDACSAVLRKMGFQKLSVTSIAITI